MRHSCQASCRVRAASSRFSRALPPQSMSVHRPFIRLSSSSRFRRPCAALPQHPRECRPFGLRRRPPAQPLSRQILVEHLRSSTVMPAAPSSGSFRRLPRRPAARPGPCPSRQSPLCLRKYRFLVPGKARPMPFSHSQHTMRPPRFLPLFATRQNFPPPSSCHLLHPSPPTAHFLPFAPSAAYFLPPASCRPPSLPPASCRPPSPPPDASSALFPTAHGIFRSASCRLPYPLRPPIPHPIHSLPKAARCAQPPKAHPRLPALCPAMPFISAPFLPSPFSLVFSRGKEHSPARAPC